MPSSLQRAIDEHGRIDVIVNNAGIMPIAPMEALKVEEWDRHDRCEYQGPPVRGGRSAAIMQKQKQGHIVNIASVFGFKVFAPGGTVYSATKFAVRAVTEGPAHGTTGLTTFAAP